MIRMTCDACGAAMAAAEEAVGQSGPCVRCGHRLTVPGAPVGRGQRFKTLVITLAILAVAFTGLLAVGMTAYLLKPSPARRPSVTRTDSPSPAPPRPPSSPAAPSSSVADTAQDSPSERPVICGDVKVGFRSLCVGRGRGYPRVRCLPAGICTQP